MTQLTGRPTGRPTDDHVLAAFARVASTIACSGPLQTVLDRLAEEVERISRDDACALTLVSRLGTSVDMVGAAGYPEGYRTGVQRALSLRAPLLSLEAYRAGGPIVRDIGYLLAGDPRFAPYAEMVEVTGWSTLVTIPLVVRDESVGVLTALYSGDAEIARADLGFLTAMADHGAVAVSTARLLAEAGAKAAQDERNRMAREVHDAVSQALFSMRLRVQALQLVAERADAVPDKLHDGLAALGAVVESAVDDMRALVQHLRPDDLHGDDLAEAIGQYVSAVAGFGTAAVDVRVAPDLPALPEPVLGEVYVIAREAVTNALDHAVAEHITVRLAPDWEGGRPAVAVQVADDGSGFDPDLDRPGHLGLISMRERAAEIGATLAVTSSSTGTTVRLVVPVPADPEER